MVDRVKYFVLAVLFLVVAGVIAYDRWNSGGPEPVDEACAEGERLRANVDSGEPPRVDPGPLQVKPKPDEERRDQDRDGGPAIVKRGDVVRKGSLNLPFEKKGTNRKPERKVSPNKPGPTPRPRKTPARTRRTVHIVQSGESLERIALRYYKTRKGIAWIVDANGLKDANTIYAKQRLVIPARKESTRRAPTKTKAPRSRPRTYTVKAGDGDLYAICRRFYGKSGQGSRVASIMELNKLYSADIAVGTVLILPSK